MVIRSGLISLCFVFAASTAFAQEAPYADRDTNVVVPHRTDQLELLGTGAFGVFGRETGTAGAYALGGEAAYVFGGLHGIRLGYLYGEGIFGPSVHMIDLDYSVQWSSRRWRRKLWVDVGALLGPSMGIVSYGGNQPDVHTTFGARGGVFADVHLGWLTLGGDASYRFGFSNDFGAETFGSVGIHAGVTVDVL